MSDRRAWGYALVTTADDGTVLDAWFPEPRLGALPAGADPLIAPAEFASQEGEDRRRGVSIAFQTVIIDDLDAAPVSVVDVYLRLHLLSHLLVQPNALNLDGVFGLLPVVAWTNAGPVLPAIATARRVELQRAGISIHSLDKFPRLTDYVIPERVRIADTARIRLGAHLAPGTTVMHEGFVNWNAGTLGASMVEGRISQGVVVGDGSDIGGGASIMGTLSGGGTHRISIGKRSLLGANSGIGISIGDDCVVEAGLYITAGTKVVLIDPSSGSAQQPTRREIKAAELSGASGVLYRRNSLTGAVEALPRTGEGVALNSALHA